MKGNHKRMWRSVIAMILTFTLVFGTASTAFATGAVGSGEGESSSIPAIENENVITYVSIGDSMTNGYGMPGYDGESGVVNYAKQTYGNQFAAWLAGYEGTIADDQVIFEGTNATVDHRQLAMSGLRAEDLNWILNLDYEDEKLLETIYNEWDKGSDWGSKVMDLWYDDWGFKTGDFRTWTDFCDYDYRYADAAARILATYNGQSKTNGQYFMSSYATEDTINAAIAGVEEDKYFPEGKEETDTIGGYQYLQTATEFYQDSVKNADVISVALGNTNFGTYMLTEIMEVVMYNNVDRFPDRYDIEKVFDLADMDPKVEKEIRGLIDEYDTIIDKYFATLADGDEAKMEALKDIIIYCVASYAVNYVGSIQAILEVNPDVDIIQVALMNAYADESADIVGTTLGDIVDVLYTPINAFIAAVPTVMQAKGLYEEAEFFYAEADSVECLVSVFGDDFYTDADGNEVKYPGMLNGDEDYTPNMNSTVRARFYENIVKGQTFGMLGSFGVVEVSLEEIIAYDMMTPSEKAAYAAQEQTRAKAISCALYLAFENATIQAGKGTVTMDSLAALGQNLTDVFGPVVTTVKANATAYAKENDAYVNAVARILVAGGVPNIEIAESLVSGKATVYDIVSAGIEGGSLTPEDIEALCAAKGADATIYEVVANKSGGQLTTETLESVYKNVVTARKTAENYGTDPDAAEMTVYYNIIATKIGQSVENVKALYENSLNDDVVALVNALKKAVASVNSIKAGYSTISEKVASLKVASESADSLCFMLGLPEALVDSMVADSTLSGIMCMNARILIGTGIGGHPSQGGHDALYEAIKESYETKHTSQDQTIDNLVYVVTEYYDEAYAYAYQYADKEGYIDATIEGIDAVMAEMEKAVAAAEKSGMSDELKAELRAAYENAKPTAEQLKKLIKEADVLDEETYNNAVALLAELEQNLNDMYSVLEQVGSDSAEQLKIAYEYLKPIVINQLKIAVEKGTEWLMKKAQEAYDAFIAALPEIDKALYDWFYNNPETVIGFFYEYGDELGYIFDKYGESAVKVLAYVLYTYGPEAVEYAIENPEEALAKWVEWYNKHGERVWPMIDKYIKTLDEMGAFDGLKAAAAELEDYVIAYAEKVVAELQAKIDELNAAAKAALEDLKQAIEDAKNGADNGISRIMKALENLYNQGVAIYEGATSGYYTVTDDSYYVALGDTDVEYAEIVADEMKLDRDQFTNAGIDGMRAEDLRMILDADYEADAYGQAFGDVTELRAELIEEIEKSDLITLGFSNNTVTEFAAGQIAAMIAGEEPVAMDWARYIGKDGAAVMADAMTEIKAALVAEGVDAETIDLVATAIESYAYACTGFTVNYPAVVELINDINPDTQVVVVGMYNPFENAVVEVEGTQIPLGEFVGVLVDLVNVYYTSHAILTGDAIYVHAPAVETEVPFEEVMGIDEFITAVADLDALEPSAAGHTYIANQIMEAMNVVDKDVFNTLKYIDQIKAFGDVTRDNLADARALADAARAAYDGLTDAEKENIGLDNYKIIVDFELAVAKVELEVAEDIAAAEKALKDAEAKAIEIERALKITDSTVTDLKAKVVNKSQIKVTWKAPETTPDQYRVALIRDGKKVGTYWVNGSKNTVTLKNILRGTNFTVRVTPVAKVDDQKYFSIYKTSNKVKTQLQKANLTVKKSGKHKLIKSADQNSTGFQIYISKSKNFKNDVTKLKIYTGKKGLNKVIKAKNFKKGVNYVKVRSYTKVNGKTVYGAWSGTVKVTK